MYNKLSLKIFYIVLVIFTLVLISILIFIIYIIPNLYHSYSVNKSEGHLDYLTTCISGIDSCEKYTDIVDNYFIYVTNNETGDITTLMPYYQYGFYTSNNIIIPDYEYVSKDIIVNDVSYTMNIEVKNIDTSFFKNFIIPLFIIVLIISSITSYFISRLFTRPIKTINRQIEELENLNFNTTLYVNKKDELGEISNSLVKLNEVISLGISSIEAEKKNSDDFLKIMSHELKTPLTVVRGYNELLTMDTNLEPKQIKYLDNSIAEIDKITQIINNSIISSKLDSMQDNLHYKVINLDQLVKNEITTYNSIYPNVEVHFNIDEYEYKTNPDIIKLAIKNIIENAFLHHSNNTKIDVTLKNNYLEVTNFTTNIFNTSTIRNKNNKNLGVYIIITVLQLLNLKYEFTLVDNKVTFKILLKENIT